MNKSSIESSIESDEEYTSESQEEEYDEFGNSINSSSSEKNNDIKSIIREVPLPPPPKVLPSRAVFNSENDYGRCMRRKYNRQQTINTRKHIESVGLSLDHPNASEYTRCTNLDLKKEQDDTFSRGQQFQKAQSLRDKKIHQEYLEKINQKSS
jgi:hypothetical protein